MSEKNLGKKKIWLIAAAVALSIILLAVGVPLAILMLDQPDDGRHMTIHFADPSLSADIYADSVYMSYDRAIHYTTNDGYAVTVEIPESDYHRYPDEVQLLIRLVAAATAGDADAYNACFSPEYIAASGKEEPFTMQKIYDIEIVNYHQSGGTPPEAYLESSVYGLRYKIKDNNGSLRYDMGSDAIHEQYMSIVLDAKGDAYIYGVQLRYIR